MGEEEHDTDHLKVETLEHSDTAESFRQLWWTIGVTVVGVAVAAMLYL